MNRRIVVWLALVVALVAFVTAAAASSTGSTTVPTVLVRHGVSYVGTVVQDGDSKVRVAMVPIRNTLVEGRSAPDGSTTGGEDVVRMLDAIREDAKSWDAVILELDTPGGSVIASEEITAALRRISKETKLPVLAWMRGTAASAGYYVAAPTDRIVASANTFTGSIGVILQYFVVEELAEKVGVEAVTVKSGQLKDLGNPFRKTTEQERELFQTVIDQAYEQFVGVVAKGRSMSRSKVRELADGRIYTGAQAKELGLVDVLGLRETAYDEVADLIGRKGVDGEDLDVVRFGRRYGFFDALLAEAGPTLASIERTGDVVGALRGDPAAIDRVVGADGGDDGAARGVARLEYRAVLG
jgi:protease IV